MSMKKIKIISDSTCDLSEDLKERYDIGIIPLNVILGEDTYRDGVDVMPDDIYAWAERNQDTPKTAAPSIEDTEQIFEQYLEDYDDIICFSISSGMSSSNSIMNMAAEETGAKDRIHVIDSANLSTGIGLLVLEAAQMASDGADADTIVDHIGKIKPLIRSSFIIDTLTYLHRGGRCSGLTAYVGGKLKLHPKISVTDGEMTVGKKYRGNIDNATLNYVYDLETELKNADPKRIFITHSGCSEQLEKKVYEYVRDLGCFDEILITRAGSVVSCHCGPGTLGLLYIAKEKE